MATTDTPTRRSKVGSDVSDLVTLFTDEEFAELPVETRLTWFGLFAKAAAEKDGRVRNHPRLLIAALWPLEERMSTKKMEAHIDRLATAGFVTVSEDGNYLTVTH